MCRGLVYLGEKLRMQDVFFDAPYSLSQQTINARFMFNALNLAGNGFLSWTKDTRAPILYKSEKQPFFDYNLGRLCQSMEADNCIAHIRGSSLNTRAICSYHNAHPFLFDHTEVAFAHNGGLDMGDHRQKELIFSDLRDVINADREDQIQGTTDTELLYALILTFADKYPDSNSSESIKKAVGEALGTCHAIRIKHGVENSSPMNFFFSHADYVMMLRYSFDFGVYHGQMDRHAQVYYSMWYTIGERFVKENDDYIMKPGEPKSFCCASEPLSENIGNWLEMPEYSLITVSRKNDELNFDLIDFDV